MTRPPPSVTRSQPLVPSTTLFRSSTHAHPRSRVEEVNEAVHPLEAQRRAGLQLRSSAGACNERERVGFGTRHVCVDVRLVAQFLYQVDLSCDSVSGSNHLE